MIIKFYIKLIINLDNYHTFFNDHRDNYNESLFLYNFKGNLIVFLCLIVNLNFLSLGSRLSSFLDPILVTSKSILGTRDSYFLCFNYFINPGL